MRPVHNAFYAGNIPSCPIPSASKLYHFIIDDCHDTYHCIEKLDELVELNFYTWAQFNVFKAHELFAMLTSPRWTAEKTMELISAEKTRELIAPAGNNEVHYDPFDIASLCNHCQEVDCQVNKSGKQLLTQFQKHTQVNHSAIQSSLIATFGN